MTPPRTPPRSDAATVVALHFTIQAQAFLIEATLVSRLERAPSATPVPRAQPFVVGLVRLRRVLYTLVDLAAWHGRAPAPTAPRFAIALDGDGIALAADALDGVVELPPGALHPVAGPEDEPLAITDDGAIFVNARALLGSPRLARLAT